MRVRGRLITVEGLDGAGKSTLVERLRARLEATGVRPLALREPGGTALGERLRALLRDPDVVPGPRAEALLFAAARAQLVDERLRPELAAGRWVLLDRHVDSSLVYQGAGRELGVDAVRALADVAVGDLRPDRTLLLRVPPTTGRARLRSRGEAADRMEGEDDAFFARVADAYDALATAEPERIRVLDGTAEPDAVAGTAWTLIADLLPAEPDG